MRNLLSLAIAAAASAACVSTSQPVTGTTNSPGSIQVSAGQTFGLKAGQEAAIRGTSVTVRFVSVTQDSRCPSDVQCVWAGDGAIKLGLASTQATTAESTIHTGIEPRSVEYAGYLIRVVGLTPVPKSGKTIAPSDYVVSLELTAK